MQYDNTFMQNIREEQDIFLFISCLICFIFLQTSFKKSALRTGPWCQFVEAEVRVGIKQFISGFDINPFT